MNLSYWERNSWFEDIDYAIIGSGIVGLNCALALRSRFPKARIVVFERGMLPSGASTKNAGFACFGSVSEILEDLKTHTEEEVIQLVRDRVAGLQLLRDNLGDSAIGFKAFGGYELFLKDKPEFFNLCVEAIPRINEMLKEVFYGQNEVFSVKKDHFSFKNTQKELIFNRFEAQLDTGAMMRALIKKAYEKDILIVNNAKIESFYAENDQILLKMDSFDPILAKKLFIATNGFAKELIDAAVSPARAQVLITKPIKDLHIKGTFHLDRGYYYFRNINDRILLGGGRNLDFSAEETSEMGVTALVQEHLTELLRTTILPDSPFIIDRQWSGIMGVGSRKKPIIKKLATNVYCGVRLGGMGVAIGSSVGKQLADLVNS